MIDVKKVTNDEGVDLGLVFIGNAEEATTLMIAQIQSITNEVLKLLMWGRDKEAAVEALKDAARTLVKIAKLVPAHIPMEDDGDLPKFYQLMLEDFEKAWAIKEQMLPIAKEQHKEEEAINVRHHFRSVAGKRDDTVH